MQLINKNSAVKSKMPLFKGTFNYYGEDITLWRRAKTKERAFSFFIIKLALTFGRTRYSINNYSLYKANSYIIEEKENG